MTDLAFIETLETLIASRIEESPENSYTARLAQKGILAIAQKIGEEGVELALAAAAQADDDVVNETADLLYHLLVMLAVRGIPLASVTERLERRHRERAPR